MIIDNQKVIKILKPFLITVIIFIFFGLVVNLIETYSFLKVREGLYIPKIIKSFFNITAVFSLYSVILFPPYLVIRLINQKLAQILISVFFSILILLEAGLYIYCSKTGLLMGTELIIRPFSEIWITILSSSNIFANLLIITFISGCFIFLPSVFRKVKMFDNLFFVISSLFGVGIISIFTIFYQTDNKQQINNYLETKSYYFFSSLINYSNENTTEFLTTNENENKTLIEKKEKYLIDYKNIYSNRIIDDLEYPLERSSTQIPDVLSPFFNKSEKQPNIVIIIVESLGNYLIGSKGENISFTPFLDSLVNTGLYWKNCLATTPRTFGVLPSILGSLPHGIKGFQFGIMPKHHSIYTLLKKNSYSTNFFHGGNSNFDNMLDFLTVQEIDHIDNFLSKFDLFKKEKKLNWWALYDHVMFDESFKSLNKLPKQKPYINVYLTLSTHDPLHKINSNLNLKELYNQKTEKIFSKLDVEQSNIFSPLKNRIEAFLYFDNSMRDFINEYSKRDDFANTLFIITGDHSMGNYTNELASFSVPLIIWSPLLKEYRKFPNIVSHLSIAPSIISFLQKSYNLKIPDKLSWWSDGLDTSAVFNPSEKILFLNTDRKVNSMVYNQYLFEEKKQNANSKLWEIDENLNLKQIENETIIENISLKFNTLKYINNYVYHNNKIVKNYSQPQKKYKIILDYENNDTIIFVTPDTVLQQSSVLILDIMPAHRINKYSKIKISLSADVILNENRKMLLNICCTGKNQNYESKDLIRKYIIDDDIELNKKYPLNIEKEIDVRNNENSLIHIYLSTDKKDKKFVSEKRITMSNIKVTVYGE